MKNRCLWSGYLRLCLVTIPVRVYSAVATSQKITFSQLHQGCHQRLRQKLFCPLHGEMPREAVTKGFEFGKDRFVILEPADLAKIRLDTTRTIELVQFIAPQDLDPLLLDTPYYLGPDGPVAEQSFAVMSAALARAGRIGIGRVILNGKERQIALKPLDQGLLLFTLRPAAQVRPIKEVIGQLPDADIEEAEIAGAIAPRTLSTDRRAPALPAMALGDDRANQDEPATLAPDPLWGANRKNGQSLPQRQTGPSTFHPR